MKSQSLDTQSRSGPDGAALEKFVTMLPLESYMAGEAILIAGSKTGRLLFLKSGAVVILKNSVEIATVREPGAVLGEISALLDRPHTAGVRALENSEFYIADASLLEKDPIAALYIARILARRLVAADEGLIELKDRLQASGAPKAVDNLVERIAGIVTIDDFG